MNHKSRSIIILLVVFIAGMASGFFVRGLYDHQRSKVFHQRKAESSGQSRFVGFFTRVIAPSAKQADGVKAILCKWEQEMKSIQTQFAQESQQRFTEMVQELTPILSDQQLTALKEALERFGPHRRYPRSGKKDT